MKKITYYIYKQGILDAILETTSKNKADKFFDSLPIGHTIWKTYELDNKTIASIVVKTK